MTSRALRPLHSARTDAESLRLADSFNSLERVAEFAEYQGELEREQALIVYQLTVGRAASYEHYLELRGQWVGLEQARGLPGVVVQEAIDVKPVEGSNDDY